MSRCNASLAGRRISAASITKDGATIISNKDAQAGLDAELKFFAGIANQL
jgi:hypothetical protein